MLHILRIVGDERAEPSEKERSSSLNGSSKQRTVSNELSPVLAASLMCTLDRCIAEHLIKEDRRSCVYQWSSRVGALGTTRFGGPGTSAGHTQNAVIDSHSEGQ